MKNQKIYEADDKMISIIRDNCDILQSLGSFGISLGFGDQTVSEVCESENVDTNTFLAIVNLTINGYYRKDDADNLSVETLLKYLKASHTYYIEFQSPFMRRELVEALDERDSLAQFILKLYDENAHEIMKHMRYEEKTVFPYVEQLLNGVVMSNYDINTFSQHHRQVEQRLQELKSIIIKYLPSDTLHNNLLTATLYDIYNSESWLNQHSMVDHGRRPVKRARKGHYHRCCAGNEQQRNCRTPIYISQHGDYPPSKHRPKATDPLSRRTYHLCHCEPFG